MPRRAGMLSNRLPTMKQHLRREMKATLAGMSASDAAAASAAACAAILGLDEFHEARSVMLYAPIPGEVDCVPVAEAAWRAGKAVLLPRTMWEQRHMAAVRVHSPDDEMIVTRNGIREPAGDEAWPLEDIDLVIVPALAYDVRGNRLGRGGGFYDRFLARLEMRTVLCGLAFWQQIVEELPIHSGDHPVDILVTDEKVLRFHHRPTDRQLEMFLEPPGKETTVKEIGP